MLVLIILALFFLLLGFIFVYRIVIEGTDTAKATRCQQSILKSGVDGLANLKCEATYVTLKKSELEARGNLDEGLKRKIADMMLACWKMTGSGKVDPYKNSYEAKHHEVQIYLICNILDFQDIPNFRGLNYWMAYNKPSGTTKSYYESLYGRQASLEEMDVLRQQDDSYITTNRYVVAWNYNNTGNFAYFDVHINNSVVFVPYEDIIGTNDDLVPIVMN